MMGKKQPKKYEFKVSIICKGQMIGDEDAIGARDHTTSVKCKSTTGELLEMTIQNFYQRIKGTSDDSWKIMK